MPLVSEDFKQPRTVYQIWSFVKGLVSFGPIYLASYTEDTLPEPGIDKNTGRDNEGSIIYVSDGAAGSRFRGSNGTAWVSLG